MSIDDRPGDTPEPDQQQAEEPLDPERLKEELDEALREKDQFRTMAQRAQADLINYKRRAAEELDEARRDANDRLLLRMLSIVDDLDRAVDMLPEGDVAPAWREGLLLVQRNFENALGSEGVTKIEALGQPFEPWECEAVSYEEAPGEEEGKVVGVVREGYKRRERVLRAAQVIVSKSLSQPEDQDNDEEAQ